MELKEFITGILDDITEAIKDEQKKWNPDHDIHEGVMCPPTFFKVPTGQNYKREVERVHFDLCVEERSQNEAAGSVGGRIMIAGASVREASGESSGTVQRVSFDIPLYLPF